MHDFAVCTTPIEAGMAIGPPEWMTGVEDIIFNTEGLANVLDGFARQTGTSMFIMPRGFRS